MFSDARFQSKTNEKLLCLLEHVSIDVFKLRLGLYGWNRRIRRASLKRSWKYTAKKAISRGLGPSKKKCLQTCRNFLKTSHWFKHITKRRFWRIDEDRTRAACTSTDGRTPKKVPKTANFGGFGRPIQRCLQTCRNFLKSSNMFKHITKHILWRFEEDRLRFAFRATDGRTWSHVKFSLEKRIFVCITTCAALVFTRLCLHQEVAFEHISQTSPGLRM